MAKCSGQTQLCRFISGENFVVCNLSSRDLYCCYFSRVVGLDIISTFLFVLDLTPVKDLTNAMFVETDLLPKEISRFISPDIPKVFLTSR